MLFSDGYISVGKLRPSNINTEKYISSIGYNILQNQIVSESLHLRICKNRYLKILINMIQHCREEYLSITNMSPCGRFVLSNRKDPLQFYKIITHPKTHINISVSKINLEETLGDCDAEYIKFRINKKGSNTSVAFCGVRIFEELQSYMNTFEIVYKTYKQRIADSSISLSFQILEESDIYHKAVYVKIPYRETTPQLFHIWNNAPDRLKGTEVLAYLQSQANRLSITHFHYAVTSVQTTYTNISIFTDGTNICYSILVRDGPYKHSPTFSIMEKEGYLTSGFVFVIKILLSRTMCKNNPNSLQKLQIGLNVLERGLKSPKHEIDNSEQQIHLKLFEKMKHQNFQIKSMIFEVKLD